MSLKEQLKEDLKTYDFGTKSSGDLIVKVFRDDSYQTGWKGDVLS